MNVADLELCKELYAFSGWDGTHIFYDAENDPVESRTALLMHPTKNCPAYDCGYLLRKLPTHSQIRTYYGYHHEPEVSEDECGSYAYYDYPQGKFNLYGTTPENALCRLAIELFKKGILVKELPTNE